MKKYKLNIKIASIYFIGLMMVFASCKKENDDDPKPNNSIGSNTTSSGNNTINPAPDTSRKKVDISFRINAEFNESYNFRKYSYAKRKYIHLFNAGILPNIKTTWNLIVEDSTTLGEVFAFDTTVYVHYKESEINFTIYYYGDYSKDNLPINYQRFTYYCTINGLNMKPSDDQYVGGKYRFTYKFDK